MHKLAHKSGEEWVPHAYSPIFTTEVTSTAPPRLMAAMPPGGIEVFDKLIECLTPPFLILYVLHTPRGEGDPGRYQSPKVESRELQAFISRFAPFLVGDARFDFWVHSPASRGTLVWDRHNLLYGYGPVDCYVSNLLQLGFTVGNPKVPVPHMHHYRQELDPDAQAILKAFPWQYLPLRPEDEQ